MVEKRLNPQQQAEMLIKSRELPGLPFQNERRTLPFLFSPRWAMTECGSRRYFVQIEEN